MSDADEKWQEALEQLKQGFAERLPAKVGEVEAAWSVLDAGWSADLFTNFFRLVHGVAGTCATYGFMDVSQKARQLEAFLREMRDKEDISAPPDENKKGEIIRFLHDLSASIPSPAPDQPH